MPKNELIKAAGAGNLGQVKQLIAADAGVNLADQYGNTALILAAHNGHEAIVRQLIAAKANVNLANRNGDTALILATENGHVAIVEQLIAAKANVNLANRIGDTALMWAAENGYEAIVRQLIAAGANVNLANWNGDTALILAAKNGHAAIVEQLIANGANVNLADQYGDTALILAVKNGHAAIVRQLIAAGANVKHVDQDGATALMMAAKNGHAAIVRELIAAKANVYYADQFGNTALMWAAENGHEAIVQQLIAAGANVNANHVNRFGDTTLILAAKNGHAAIVERLIVAGANVNLANQHGDTALTWAAKSGHKDVIRAVLGDGLFNFSSTGEEFQQSLDRINQITLSLDCVNFEKDRTIIREFFSQFLKESIEQVSLAECGEEVLKKLTLLRDKLSIIQQNEEEKKSGKQKTEMKALLAIIDRVTFDQEEKSWEKLIEAANGVLSSSNLNNQAINESINTLLNIEMLPNGKAKKELLNYLKTLKPTDFNSLKTKLKCIALATEGVGVRQEVQGKLRAIFSDNKTSHDQNPYLFILRTGQSKFKQKDTISFDMLKDRFKPSKPGFFNRGFKPSLGTSSNKKKPLPGLKNNRGEDDL